MNKNICFKYKFKKLYKTTTTYPTFVNKTFTPLNILNVQGCKNILWTNLKIDNIFIN